MKKFVMIFGLAALVVLQAAFAWNARLCWRAKAVARAADEKVRLLERARSVFPWNAAVAYELGQVWFERGVESLAEPAARDTFFRRSIGSYLAALRLDPGSPESHFALGQALLYADYAGQPAPLPYFDEYRRAAELTGHNSRIHYETGKVLLGRWDSLTPEEKDFVAGLLRSSIAGKGEERLLDLLEAWNLAGRDAELIDRVLPEEPEALRAYARFLGERSLSLAAREDALARAEALEVGRARAAVDAARRASESFRPAEAADGAAAALEALGSVRFYQALRGRELFDPRDYESLRRSARRLLAMSRVEETRSLDDRDGAIAAYLDIEDDFTALGEFEAFLKERGLLGESDDSPFKDLKVLAFRLGLDLKLNRYRDIARVGGILASSSIVIAPSGKTAYARILGLIGEANLKLDNVYEAERSFRKALEAAPDDLGTLAGLARCYERLNDDARAAEVRLAMGRLTSPAEIDLGARPVPKGESAAIELVTAGGPRMFRLAFAPDPAGGQPPLVTIVLDGRVVWEKIGDTGIAEFFGTLPQGRASLEVVAVGGPLRLARLGLALPVPQRSISR